jgi:putative DNA primase/helicase
LFEPNGVEFPPVPDNPTKQQAQDALKILKHLLREFPFVTDADRSVALSGLLTALDRRAMAQAPMHGSTAPVIASGKTLLWNIATLIATGQEVAVVAQGWDDEELEKRLGAALLGGQGSISIDNCVRPVGGDFLNTVLTSPRVKLRPLGTSQEIEVPTNATMFCNGNNITFKADFTRRVLLSTIDPKLERPESRKFQSDPKAEIDRRRGEFVIAALTVLRAYHVAKPNIDLTPFASYEDYNYRIIGPLLWLGEANPRDTAKKIIAEDPERQEINAVMQGWWSICKDNRRRAFEIISAAGATEAADTGDFYNVLRDIAPNERGGLNAKRLGNWLRKHKGRIVNGMKFVEDGESHLGMWWKLEKVGPGVTTTIHRSSRRMMMCPFENGVQGLKGLKGLKTPPFTKKPPEGAVTRVLTIITAISRALGETNASNASNPSPLRNDVTGQNNWNAVTHGALGLD